jgi:hypothetical protein
MKTALSKASRHLTVAVTSTQELTRMLSDATRQMADTVTHVRLRMRGGPLLSLYVIIYREFRVLLLREIWYFPL